MTERIKALETRRPAEEDEHMIEVCGVCGCAVKDHKNGFCPTAEPEPKPKRTLGKIKFRM